MKRLTLAAVLLAGTAFTAPASAATLTWNFGEHGFGALPSVQQFDTGGKFLTAKGFNGLDAPIAMFSKNGGTGEVGLGLNGLVDDEISGLNFLQISVDTMRASLTNFKFSMDSVDNSEGWVVYGSMDATPFTFVQLAHSFGTLDNGVHSLADGFDNYNFLFAPSGAGGPTGNSDVLLHSFSADLQAVPIPPALALFGAGLAGLGWLTRRRKQSLNLA